MEQQRQVQVRVLVAEELQLLAVVLLVTVMLLKALHLRNQFIDAQHNGATGANGADTPAPYVPFSISSLEVHGGGVLLEDHAKHY